MVVEIDAAVTYVGTVLLAAVFYAVTAHLAATWAVGDVPVVNAIVVGPVPAVVLGVVGLVWIPMAAVLALVADFLAIRTVYDLDDRIAALTTLLHVVITIVLVFSVFRLVALL